MDDYDNKFEEFQQIQQSRNINSFESPESIARHILEHEPRQSESVNSDSPRANLNPSELRTARVIGDMIGLLEHAEKVCGWQLGETKEFFKDCLSTTNVPSRSKDGFAIVLSKTDRRVQTPELNQFAGEVSGHFNEQTEENLASKIPFIGGFLKKKQVGANNG